MREDFVVVLILPKSEIDFGYMNEVMKICGVMRWCTVVGWTDGDKLSVGFVLFDFLLNNLEQRRPQSESK
jgi:hypothetical protein